MQNLPKWSLNEVTNVVAYVYYHVNYEIAP